MQFKHPELLYALFLLLIPILVHLFQLRRFKKEAFTNVAFLKQITIQTRKSSQLKKWLTLLARLLALAAIIFAFAQPYTSNKTHFTQEEETVIYLDNSFSMQKKGASGELLKRAIQELIENTDEAKPITLYTNSDTYINTAIKPIQNELLKMSYSPQQLDYNALVLKGKGLFSDKVDTKKQLILISDFQVKENNFAFENDSLIEMHLVKLNPVNTNNIVLDSLYISSITPNTTELSVLVKSNSANEQEVAISLYNDDELIAKTGVTVNKQAIAEFSIPVNQTINGRVTIDDPNLTFDNTLYFNINQKPKINVLVISEGDDTFLSKIFTENEFNYTAYNSSALDFNQIKDQNIIVLNELKSISNALITALQNFEDNGGSLIIIPSNESLTSTYNQLVSNHSWNMGTKIINEKRITTIHFSHPVFQEVFSSTVTNFQYPLAQSHYPIQYNLGSKMLSFDDASPFLLHHNATYLFASALQKDNSNFTNSDLVISFYAIARNSLKASRLYFNVGENTSFDVDISLPQDEIITLKNVSETVIPRQQYYNNKVSVFTEETPENAGIYQVTTNVDILQNVSFNFDRSESNLTYHSIESLGKVNVSDSVNSLLSELKNDSKINVLWKWFVIFALVFLIIEMLLLKYLK